MTTTNDHTSNTARNGLPQQDATSPSSRINPTTGGSKSNRSIIARTASGWSSAAVSKVRDNVVGWTRVRRPDDANTLGICLSVDPGRTSCIVGIIGVVDETNVRDLSRALHTVRSYRFVSIDLSSARFAHPVAQLRFDHLTEQLEIAGITVVVSGARDDMGPDHS